MTTTPKPRITVKHSREATVIKDAGETFRYEYPGIEIELSYDAGDQEAAHKALTVAVQDIRIQMEELSSKWDLFTTD